MNSFSEQKLESRDYTSTARHIRFVFFLCYFLVNIPLPPPKKATATFSNHMIFPVQFQINQLS